jgi:hypothetical protein
LGAHPPFEPRLNHAVRTNDARMRTDGGGARSEPVTEITPAYALASHVFACLDGDRVVLLDLKQDRYFTFERMKARGLETFVAGWPAPPACDSGGGRIADGESIAQQLFQRGLLRHRRPAGETGRQAIPLACRELPSDQYGESQPWRLGHIVAFLIATLTAVFSLRCRSLESVVRRVKARKARSCHPPSLADLERARELTAVFIDLRPLLFSSRDKCLFESLVLIEFLASHGLFPGWVFGVQARPFAAHCWVQHGETVLNDTLEHLARYRPIMAV